MFWNASQMMPKETRTPRLCRKSRCGIQDRWRQRSREHHACAENHAVEGLTHDARAPGHTTHSDQKAVRPHHGGIQNSQFRRKITYKTYFPAITDAGKRGWPTAKMQKHIFWTTLQMQEKGLGPPQKCRKTCFGILHR